MAQPRDITAPYSPLESWLYDRFAADRVHLLSKPVLDRMRVLPLDARLLDVGCGGGQQALELAAEGYRVTGLDLSPEQIYRARKRAARRQEPGEPPVFLEGDATAMPFSDGSFEGVYSVGAVKHWADRGQGLRECVRVLVSGGLLVVAEIDRGCHLEDARRWIGGLLGVPVGLRTVGVMVFRTFVAGPSLDLRDAETLLEGLDLVDARAERVPGTPLLVMHGRRR